MLKREVLKLYQGKIASIRDYEVEQGIKQGGMVIIYKDKTMTKTVEELRQAKFQVHKTKFRSKYKPGQFYTLYDFVFVDDKEKVEMPQDNQIKLL